MRRKTRGVRVNPFKRTKLFICEYCGCYAVQKSPNQKYCSPDDKPCKYYAMLERQAKWKRENTESKPALGTSNINSHPKDDFEEELKAVRKERRRLGV